MPDNPKIPEEIYGFIDHEVESLQEIIELLERYNRNDSLFRGVTDAIDHRLIPKIGRKDFLGSSGIFDPARERRLIEDFKLRATPYLDSGIPNSDLEWLALGQHYGLATRLLDWAQSPLVATFFAVTKMGSGGRYAAVYAVHGLDNIFSDEDPFGLWDAMRYDPSHIVSRIPAQSAAFTVHAHPDTPLRPPRGQSWLRLLIHPLSQGHIKQQLDWCGISRASLFPDMEGLSDHINWRYKWRIGHRY